MQRYNTQKKLSYRQTADIIWVQKVPKAVLTPVCFLCLIDGSGGENLQEISNYTARCVEGNPFGPEHPMVYYNMAFTMHTPHDNPLAY